MFHVPAIVDNNRLSKKRIEVDGPFLRKPRSEISSYMKETSEIVFYNQQSPSLYKVGKNDNHL